MLIVLVFLGLCVTKLPQIGEHSFAFGYGRLLWLALKVAISWVYTQAVAQSVTRPPLKVTVDAAVPLHWAHAGRMQPAIPDLLPYTHSHFRTSSCTGYTINPLSNLHVEV